MQLLPAIAGSYAGNNVPLLQSLTSISLLARSYHPDSSPIMYLLVAYCLFSNDWIGGFTLRVFYFTNFYQGAGSREQGTGNSI